MRIISWNCTGLGNPTAVRALKKLLKSKCLDVVFLMETRLKHSDKKAKSTFTCGPLSNLFTIDCNYVNGHRSGGLALLWNDSVTMEILNANKMYIDAYITACNNNTSWFISGIYGNPYYSQKHLTCEAIYDLSHQRNNAKWLIFGDFNLILNSFEKLGENSIDYHHTSMFNETLNNCDLNDLGFYGSRYTWANNQSDNDHIKERLDRFCASSNWISSFPRFTNTHLLRYTSDHNPIMLDFFTTNECYNSQRAKKIHRFEQLWAHDKDSVQVVQTAWKT